VYINVPYYGRTWQLKDSSANTVSLDPFSIPAPAQWRFAVFGAANAFFSCLEKLGKFWGWGAGNWCRWAWNIPQIVIARKWTRKWAQWCCNLVRKFVRSFYPPTDQDLEAFVTPHEVLSPTDPHPHRL